MTTGRIFHCVSRCFHWLPEDKNPREKVAIQWEAGSPLSLLPISGFLSPISSRHCGFIILLNLIIKRKHNRKIKNPSEVLLLTRYALSNHTFSA
jgi:hypothetical protein